MNSKGKVSLMEDRDNWDRVRCLVGRLRSVVWSGILCAGLNWCVYSEN